MSFSIERLPDTNIIVTTLHEDYTLQEEIAHSDQATLDIIEAGDSDEKYSLIIDFEVRLSLDDIMVGASNVSRGEKALWHHPQVEQVIFVTNDDTLKMTAKGLSSDAFGNLDIAIYGSLDEAIEHAQST